MSEQNPITEVLDAILAGARREQVAAADAFADQAAVSAAIEAVRAGKLTDFSRALTRPAEKVVRGVLAKELPGNHRAQFLFAHHHFVETQVRAMVEELDGLSCCADRTRTILRALTQHLMTKKPILFDYSQEYTFHLPVRVFRTEQDIVAFFSAVMELYYGKTAPFIASQASLREAAAALPRTED